MKAAIACLFLAGCAATQPAPPRVIDNSCSWLPKLTASPKDTEETKRQILAYATAYNKNCQK